METTVVNFKKEPCDVKICRLPDNSIPDAPNPGCFGNPFHVDAYGRKKCIAMYEHYFHKRIHDEPEFRKAVLSLRGKRLGCFCKPLDCHGDIIKEWLDNNV
jgi:hypothetical protein